MIKYAERRTNREEAAITLISNLDRDKLAYLYSQFQGCKAGMNVIDFIRSEADINDSLNSSNINLDHMDKIIELFKEIDVNGDEGMEWNEFTKFVADKAASFESKHFGSSNDEHGQYKAQSIDEYRPKTDQIASKSSQIMKMIRIPFKNRLAYTESQQPIIWILNAFDCSDAAHVLLDSVPLCLKYMTDDHCIAIGCSDMTLAVVSLDNAKPSQRFKVKSSWPAPCAQSAVSWCDEYDKLYSGGVDGRIMCWNVDHVQDQQTQSAILQGHTDSISDLCVMPVLGQLISSSLDTTIGLWDIITSKRTNELRGHKKAIHCLSYSAPRRIICSAGFDHHANIWSPFMNRPIARLEGHDSSIIGCEIVDNSPEVITADSSGIIKVWDIRTFRCVQSLSTLSLAGQSNSSFRGNNAMTQNKSTLSAFLHMSLPSAQSHTNTTQASAAGRGRIFASTRHLLVFDQFRSKIDATTCDTSIRWATFNTSNMTIAVATDKEIEIWDGISGTLRSNYGKFIVDGVEISSCCLDNRKRKLIVGDSSGSVYVLNYRTGGLMKSIRLSRQDEGNFLSTLYQSNPTTSITRMQKKLRQNKRIFAGVKEVPASNIAVRCMMYLEESRSILVGLSDSTVRVISEADPEICSVVRQFDNAYKHDDLLTVASCKYSEFALTIGTSSAEGIRIWDLSTGKCEFIIHIVLPRQIRHKFENSNQSHYGFESLSPGFNCIGSECSVEDMSVEDMLVLEDVDLIVIITSSRQIMVFGGVGTYWEGLKLFCFQNVIADNADLVVDAFSKLDVKTLRHGHPRVMTGPVREGTSTLDAFEQVEICGHNAITSLAWSKEHLDLFVGDDAGFMTKWNISQAYYKLTRSIKCDWETTDCLRQCDGVCRPSESISRRSSLIPVIEESDVVFQWKVKAHSQRCIHIEVTEKLGLLVSCGEDRCVHLWDCDGTILGVLLQAASTSDSLAYWQLPKRLDELCESELGEMSVFRDKFMAHRMDDPDRDSGTTGGFLSDKLSKTVKALGLDLDESDLETLSSSGSKIGVQSYCISDSCSSLSRNVSALSASRSIPKNNLLKERRSKSLNRLGRKVLDMMDRLDTAIDKSQLIS